MEKWQKQSNNLDMQWDIKELRICSSNGGNKLSVFKYITVDKNYCTGKIDKTGKIDNMTKSEI